MRNVLLITVDQERYFGQWPASLHLPARQRLTDTGVTFERHYIASAICSPSRSVMYTGQHMPKTRIFDNASFRFVPGLSPGVRTVGHMLRDLGYYTAYKGKWHLNFDLEHDPARDHDYSGDMERYGFSDFNSWGDFEGGILDGYQQDGRIAEDAISWLRSKGTRLSGEGTPWFLTVNFINPHDIMYFVPGQQREPGKGMFPTQGAAQDRPPYSDRHDYPLPSSLAQPIDDDGRPAAHAEYLGAMDALLGPIGPARESYQMYQDYYFNCLQEVDRRIGTVLDELECLGMREDTVVVFTSDHGELGGAHGLTGKGGFAYEENCHVPFIVCRPEGPSGQRCAAVTSHVDLAPTLVGSSGADDVQRAAVTEGLPGHNLMPLLEAPGCAATDAIREGALFAYSQVISLSADFVARLMGMCKQGIPKPEIAKALAPDFDKRGFTRTVIDGRYKYTRYFAPKAHNRPETLDEIQAVNDIEFFDILQDPSEMVNLAVHPREHEELIVELNAKLNRLIDREIGIDDGSYLPGHEEGDWYLDDLDHM